MNRLPAIITHINAKFNRFNHFAIDFYPVKKYNIFCAVPLCGCGGIIKKGVERKWILVAVRSAVDYARTILMVRRMCLPVNACAFR